MRRMMACAAISTFFAEKLRKIQELLKFALAGTLLNLFSFDALHFW